MQPVREPLADVGLLVAQLLQGWEVRVESPGNVVVALLDKCVISGGVDPETPAGVGVGVPPQILAGQAGLAKPPAALDRRGHRCDLRGVTAHRRQPIVQLPQLDGTTDEPVTQRRIQVRRHKRYRLQG